MATFRSGANDRELGTRVTSQSATIDSECVNRSSRKQSTNSEYNDRVASMAAVMLISVSFGDAMHPVVWVAVFLPLCLASLIWEGALYLTLRKAFVWGNPVVRRYGFWVVLVVAYVVILTSMLAAVGKAWLLQWVSVSR